MAIKKAFEFHRVNSPKGTDEHIVHKLDVAVLTEMGEHADNRGLLGCRNAGGDTMEDDDLPRASPGANVRDLREHSKGGSFGSRSEKFMNGLDRRLLIEYKH